MSTTKDNTSTYAQGHSAAVVSSHKQRTVQNSATFLLPHLRPHHHILDMGCGPGTITVGFHEHVPQGSVTGIDFSAEITAQATEAFPTSKYPKLKFEEGNPLADNGLKYDNDTFDVVYTSQTILHMPDPVRAMKEAYRVLKPNGILAMRETDDLIWYPSLKGTEIYNTALDRSIRKAGGPGLEKAREIPAWARQAGFDRSKMVVGGGSMIVATPEDKQWYADGCIARFNDEKAGGSMRKAGVTEEEVEIMTRDIRKWQQDVDAWYYGVQVELICCK